MKRQAMALLIAVGLMVGTLHSAVAIVRGNLDGNRHPHVGAIVVDPPTDAPFALCSGARIASGKLLTAAHCLVVLDAYKADGATIHVTFDPDASKTTAYRDAWDDHPHPDFNRRRSNSFDIGVLTFDDAPSGPTANVADVDDYSKAQLRKARFTTVGYGVTRDSNKQAHQALGWMNAERWVATQSMQSRTKAWLTLAMNNRSTDNGGTCYGDSGGPHFFEDTTTIVSITVTGDTFCKATDKTYRVDTPWVHAFLDNLP